jgi:hypothetical protein
MKRIGITCAAVAAIALPATAMAANTNHFGHLLGAKGSAVKFKERLSAEGSTVTSFAVRDFEVACDGGTIGLLRVAKLKGDVDVSATGGFKVTDDNGETVFKVKGQIRRNKAFGTFRYFGAIEGTDGVARDCDSGRLAWVTRP